MICLSVCVCVCTRASVCMCVGVCHGCCLCLGVEVQAEMERLEAWLLPVGTRSLFNKRVWRPEGHVREMLLPGSYE